MRTRARIIRKIELIGMGLIVFGELCLRHNRLVNSRSLRYVRVRNTLLCNIRRGTIGPAKKAESSWANRRVDDYFALSTNNNIERKYIMRYSW